MLEKARKAGAEVTMESKDLTIDSSIGPVPVRIAFFKGPHGEIIELFQNSILQRSRKRGRAQTLLHICSDCIPPPRFHCPPVFQETFKL
jgi:hypothetical protein